MKDFTESRLSETLSDFEAQLPACIKLAYLPTPGVIRLRLTARGLEIQADDGISMALFEFSYPPCTLSFSRRLRLSQIKFFLFYPLALELLTWRQQMQLPFAGLPSTQE